MGFADVAVRDGLWTGRTATNDPAVFGPGLRARADLFATVVIWLKFQCEAVRRCRIRPSFSGAPPANRSIKGDRHFEGFPLTIPRPPVFFRRHETRTLDHQAETWLPETGHLPLH